MQVKVVLVTGASHGIGEAVALEFARKGYALAINCLSSKDKLERLAQVITERFHVPCLPLVGDISDETFVENAFGAIQEKFGRIDVLVNNAGISYIGLLTDMRLAEWERVMQVNLTSLFCCCKHAIPLMLREKSGAIVNISSVWGNVGASCEVAYSASKGGVNAFTKALAKELAPSGISVNAIACGAINTRMNQCFSQEEHQQLEEEIPAGRFGTPEEVARLAASIAESPSYLTGQVISLDGGWR